MLGNGKQRKSYLYVQDCVDAMLTVIGKARRRRSNVYNLGTDEYCEVNDSIGWICETAGRHARAASTPAASAAGSATARSSSSTRKRSASLGWKPKLTIRQGVEKTVEYLRDSPWLFETRH